ncbi:hypothetical protein [Rhizobium phaseoli]|uniref:hypothetical protein n=1 Tax=Rhizobium phaseoli TaxID=396 RepID=UPI000202CF7B|nr:hypothetical protein [Rhizobium phaseoli]EGE56923.1 hypothetical protein RHECNPAF_550047 [Rhizobium etli CNPAF512]MDK4724550.1 hypothetical protein [Rhizobium phaseoli]NKE88545.1 hypothetical protein [Rhizobium phaseoli]
MAEITKKKKEESQDLRTGKERRASADVIGEGRFGSFYHTDIARLTILKSQQMQAANTDIKRTTPSGE